ncbi:nucleotidyltransferase domain-containing protein [Leptolyngbya sp. CCNP1308]|uniref:nucleotidyltransferase domain-containing protein n=1 Tax=Leptolyngbya sp. CCNP1308 TaxID=3110255 RepID=UPI002B20D4A9|nr:nucleotidyltransferase domain-containing protein [Leptolyngbya sp. CCNP1308]MEA5447523.1 nucleotidyltransferase domain-containing protein [Leptolyngbya sp. CCNP1308]
MVTLNASTQSLLAQLHAHLKTLYGQRLYQVMLFGSHARGEARLDSDVDVLVVLTGAVNPGQEISNISEFLANLSLEYDKVIGCLFMDETRYTTRQGPLLRNIRREGIAL